VLLEAYSGSWVPPASVKVTGNSGISQARQAVWEPNH